MYFTYLGATGFCPHIKATVTLSGKYKEIDDTTFEFALFTCPIVENAKRHTNRVKSLSIYHPVQIQTNVRLQNNLRKG